jgi:sulfopyruvate decarboxylase TPP-binding subunit
MAVTAKFSADFSSFQTAVQKAESSLNLWQANIKQVESSMKRLDTAFSGRSIAQEASQVAAAIEKIGGASKLTEKEQERVNATVTEAIAKYKVLGQEAPKAVLDLAKATAKVPEQMTLASQGVNLLKSSFGQFTAANLASAAISSLVGEVGRFIGQGVQLRGVEQSFQRLSAGVKVNSSDMLSALQTGTRGMVSNLDLMTQANKAMLLGLPVSAQSMGELAETATKLGKAMGQDATKSLDDLITALGRSSPLILDNLGLTVKVGEANEAYAKTLGKTSDQLTDSEKKMAFYLAAMEKAREKTKELGDQTKTLGEIASTVWTGFGNVVSATTASINTGLGAVLSNRQQFIQFLSDITKMPVAAAIAAADLREQLKGLAAEAGKTSGATKGGTEALRDYVQELKDTGLGSMRLSGAFKAQYDAAVKLGVSTEEITKRFGLSAFQQKLLAEQTKTVAKIHKDAEKAAKDQAKALQELLKPTVAIKDGLENLKHLWPEVTKVPVGALQLLTNTTLIQIGAVHNWREELEHVNAAMGRMIPNLAATNETLAKQEQAINKVGEQAKKSLGEELEKGLNFGSKLADAIIGAIQGGGDIGKSIGSFLGAEIGKSLGEELAKNLAKTLGDKLGGALGGLLGPLGAIGGNLIGGLIDKIFSKAGRNAVEDFGNAFEGGFGGLRTKLNELGAEGERLWVNLTQRVSRGNVQQAESAIKAIETALAAHGAAVSKAEAEAAAIREKATAAHQAAIDKVKSRISDLDSEYNSLYNTIKNEAPEDEMGIIERNTRAEMDRIRKEREVAQSELERITGAMEDSFRDVADAARDAARAIIDAFAGVGRRPTEAPEDVPGFNEVAGQNSFAGGTGGFRNFGAGTWAKLHGTEAVIRPSDLAPSSGGGDIVIPISIGGRQIETIVVDALNRTYRVRNSVGAV